MKERRVYIETYGCQMNEYDSGIVKSILGENGFSPVAEPENADLILLNTCAVREKAHERVYGRLENLQHLRKKTPGLRFGILGCMAQNLKDKLSELPVDIILGPDNYRDLPDLLNELDGLEEHHPLSHTILSQDETYEEYGPGVIKGCLAIVTIMRGCNNFCSFCVVPYTRGRERSRNPEGIVFEIQNLVKEGIKEVTLLGQNVNSYNQDGTDFTELVRKILNQTEIERIRFSSPHPMDFPEKLLELMAMEERFCSQIHLPLQSGSTEVLKNMKRGYSREDYINLVNKIRSIVPNAGLTTDIIVGFSGETDKQYNETLDMVGQVGYDMAYMFKYSERENTVASRSYPDDVPEEIKKERLSRLIDLQNATARKMNEGKKGEIHQVLVEGSSRRSEDRAVGRTHSGKVVIFPGQFPRGTTVRVRIESSTSATLFGSALIENQI